MHCNATSGGAHLLPPPGHDVSLTPHAEGHHLADLDHDVQGDSVCVTTSKALQQTGQDSVPLLLSQVCLHACQAVPQLQILDQLQPLLGPDQNLYIKYNGEGGRT